jgi:WD40 repeat protein
VLVFAGERNRFDDGNALAVFDGEARAELYRLEMPPNSVLSSADEDAFGFYADGAKLWGRCSLKFEPEGPGAYAGKYLSWDAETGELLGVYDEYGADGDKYVSLVSRDGRTGGGWHGNAYSGEFRIYDLASMETLAELNGLSNPNALRLDGDLTRLVHTLDTSAEVYDLRTGALSFTIADEHSGTGGLSGYTGFLTAVSEDGSAVCASHAETGVLDVFDAAVGELRLSVDISGLKPNCLVFSPDGGQILAADGFGEIRLFDAYTGAEIFSVYDPYDIHPNKKFSKDGGFIYGPRGVRDARSGENVLKITTGSQSIDGIWLSGDNRTLVYRQYFYGREPAYTTRILTLPTLGEGLSAAQFLIDGYEFSREDKLRFGL